MKAWVIVLVGVLLLARPAQTAPLLVIEPVSGEKEQRIRIQAQGPLPFEVVARSADSLLLFLPRAELGNVPPLLSLAPLAEISLEQNPIGLYVRLEKLEGSFRVERGKPGVVEIVLRPVPKEEPGQSTPATSTLSGGNQPSTNAPTGSAPATGQPANTPQPGGSSDTAEEEADPPRPGIPPVRPRTTRDNF